MELREWLIILGLILMAIIVIDGVRRLQRQRQSSSMVSPSDAREEKSDDALARETAWELPNGGARVVESATVAKPERQETAFERRGLKTRFPTRPADEADIPDLSEATHAPLDTPVGHESVASADHAPAPQHEHDVHESVETASPRRASHAPILSDVDETLAPEPLDIDDEDADEAYEDEDEHTSRDDHRAHDVDDEEAEDPRYEGLSEILWRRPMDGIAHLREVAAERREKRAEAREASRIKRLEARERRAEEKAQRQAEKLKVQEAEARAQRERDAQRGREAERDELLAPLHDDPLFSSHHDRDDTYRPAASHRDEDDHERAHAMRNDEAPAHDEYDERDADTDWAPQTQAVRQHPDIERAKRHLVNGQQARQTLASASEVIAIAVMARDKQGFEGMSLLNLLLACGLRYCTATRVFHRFEADDDHSPLQFTVIDTLKPGEFPLDDMAQFTTAGVWLLMPMPGPDDVTGAFDAMYETARVMARYLDGELRDENQNAMTAQTVDFVRQRAQEFERRTKLYHASR